MDASHIELEVDPPQPPAVVETLRASLVPAAPEPDPWWREGLCEALET